MAANPGRKRPVRRRPKQEEPNPIDIHVGRRLRLRRKLRGFSQGSLGERIGLTFQQVQKYEHGTSRIGASRLWELSILLDVPVQYFFDDISDETVRQMSTITGDPPGLSEIPAAYEPEPLPTPAAVKAAQYFSRIGHAPTRYRLSGLMAVLSELQFDEAIVADDSVTADA